MDKVTMSIHITFSDGSNPYCHFNLESDVFVRELLEWTDRYSLQLIYQSGTVFHFVATEHGKVERTMDREKLIDLASTLIANGWTTANKEDCLDSLRTNWETPLCEDDVQAVFEYMQALESEQER